MEAKAKATLDSRGFQGGMKKMDKSVGKFSKGLASAKGHLGALVGVGAFAALARSTIALGGKISDMATQAGISTKAFQVFSFAAREAGASEEQLRNVFVRLRKAQGDVLGQNKTLIKMFEALGISAETVVKLPLRDLFEVMARKIKAANFEGEELSALMSIIGIKNAPFLLEALDKLATEGYDKLAEKAENAGQVMSKSMIQGLDAAEDAIGRLKRSLAFGFGTGIMALEARFESLFSGGNISDATAERLFGDIAAGEKRRADLQKGIDRVNKFKAAEIAATKKVEDAKKKAAEKTKKDADKKRQEEIKAKEDKQDKKRQEEIKAKEDKQDRIKGFEYERIAKTKAAGEGGGGFGISSDSLQRIGGLAGGISDPQIPILKNQLKIAEQIAKINTEISKRIEDVGVLTA